MFSTKNTIKMVCSVIVMCGVTHPQILNIKIIHLKLKYVLSSRVLFHVILYFVFYFFKVVVFTSRCSKTVNNNE